MGFGRIGRNIFRLGYDNPAFQFVAISDMGQPGTLQYLLNRDSVHGLFDVAVSFDNNYLNVSDQSVRLLPGGKPSEIPWDMLEVDVVIDSTGVLWSSEEMNAYRSQPMRTIITNPQSPLMDRIVVMGVNEEEISIEDKVISPSSSTTQVLALMLKILDEQFGVENAMMTTVHAYTSDQPLADNTQVRRRRSRSAVENIIPNNTISPKLVEAMFPHLKGKVAGTAFNVPVPNGSCVDLTTELKKMPTVEEANRAVHEYAEDDLSNIVGYTEDPIVSSDVIGSGESMIFDAKATMIASGQFLKTVCWYDNGWGYSKRILELVTSYAKKGER
ncbi:MAG: type I glyceraldehyde-3-phosphate dehydrogenase [Candidatus Marinimicrobia bacterium]|nr:type I glyceraldehyde-3-phosphate dehydrogenase [Candidatus Neomarinimicrobiota bacterium]|tara:strand:- start:2348 stop:3334 length:987 start_codon:yes stop_codon:yes gene_type:complete